MKQLSDPLALIYPHKCILCRKVLKYNEEHICKRCAEETPVLSKRTDGLSGIRLWTALWTYENNARQSLLRYKFRRKRSYGKHFGDLLAKKVEEDLGECFDVIVYVPVSFSRKLKRGYDQVHIIAKAAARHYGMKPKKVLKKIRNNAAQSSLKTVLERENNVRDAYRVTDPDLVLGKRVLLIDDIITTGATVKECARVLRAAGAKEVLCAAVAATQGRNR